MKKTIIITTVFLVIAAIIYVSGCKKYAGKAFYSDTAYKLMQTWPQLPDTIKLGNPTGLGLDTNQNLVVFHRASREWPYIMPMPTSPIQENTVLVIDKASGKIIRSWGKGLFIMPHGLTVDHNNNIWLTDVGLHQVFKFNYQGKLILKLGEAGVPGSDTDHFNRPTDVAVAPDGSFYVSDGYGNSRIVKFSASGRYIMQWGKKGAKAGEFDTPHGIDLDKKGNVYVADRENSRVQVFTPDGGFVKAWHRDDWGSICAIAFDPVKTRFVTVDDVTAFKLKHRGSDIISIDSAGNQLARFGRSGLYNGPLSWYHDVVVDYHGNIYVGDIFNNQIQKFKPE